MAMKSPMLAKNFEPEHLKFPCYASRKLDGWRAVVIDGVVYARSGNPVVNDHVQEVFGRPEYEGFDGELIVGPCNAKNAFNTTSTFLKRKAGKPEVTFWVFDLYGSSHDYEERMRIIKDHRQLSPDCVLLIPTVINNMTELDEFEAASLAQDYEGVILRQCQNGGGKYKYGRSTVSEGLLLKVKRFSHDEAKIVGFVERMINGNEAYVDEIGRSKRSSHAANKSESGMIGSYVVESPKWEGQFNVSCGSMSHEEAAAAWRNRMSHMGLIIRFKHLAHGAVKVPRHGLFDGFRAAEDMPRPE